MAESSRVNDGSHTERRRVNIHLVIDEGRTLPSERGSRFFEGVRRLAERHFPPKRYDVTVRWDVVRNESERGVRAVVMH